jgi:hypothetical protein
MADVEHDAAEGRMPSEKTRQTSQRNQAIAAALICKQNSLSHPITSQVHNPIWPFYQCPL